MNSFWQHWQHWLAFIKAFLIVIACLAVLCGLREWWIWKKDNRK